ncbi:MAG: preprotein translocase subunit YajC [Acidobacteria bacterium]|nr:MAG: preprotein translocase subunit YajC [Acidobacteriota bacterium]
MADPRILLALASSPSGEPPTFVGLIPVVLIVGIFYFLVVMPMKSKQKKLEDLIKGLKSGDKVIINPGIFGTIVGIEEEAFQVRVDDKTKLKVLKTAVSGLQGAPQTEKK